MGGRIEVGHRSDRTVIALSGDVDVLLREHAGRALGAALTAGRPVVLDLSGVTFIDSSGIGYLVQFRRACDEVQLPCTLVGAPPSALTVLRVLGLTEHFGIAEADGAQQHGTADAPRR
ncbi:STAS domain-containing protein [Cellulomonas taurus]|uniref:STAS domain-containing protein n=1 Tax=Cellulomonas taurus TaxID=2729175 RepID=UPI00145E571F|nr:STAS domain-containing protein [Cellulomonas taurus]